MPRSTAAPKSAPAAAKAVRKPAVKATAPKATRKAAPKAAPAPKARPIGTLDKPLPSGWVRQSAVPAGADVAASKMTTQTQRRLLREFAQHGEFSWSDGGSLVFSPNVGALPGPTQRSVARLAELGFVAIDKKGNVKMTKAGGAFAASIGDAPRVRAAKPAPKAPAKAKAKAPAAKAAPAKPVATKPARKAAAKPVAPKLSPREARAARQAAAAAATK